MKTKISTVNYHLWNVCNMRCKFCYATFKDSPLDYLSKGHLNKEECKEVIKQIALNGFSKINFAGGEPTLCPWLPELVKYAKSLNLKTSIVTNGWSFLTIKNYLDKFEGALDIVGLSIDSINDSTNLESGRAHPGKRAIQESEYKLIAERVKLQNMYLKINTVVSKQNHEENLFDFINVVKPDRWKILQMLPVKGQNDEFVELLSISSVEFKQFISRNTTNINKDIKLVIEDNETITGSYIMIDPGGRFFDDTKGRHTYSNPILIVGLKEALSEVSHDADKFMSRGGEYDSISKNKKLPNRITISGEVASGKTTIRQFLASELNYSFHSIGNKTRKFSEAKGMNIVEFQQACLLDASIDKL